VTGAREVLANPVSSLKNVTRSIRPERLSATGFEGDVGFCYRAILVRAGRGDKWQLPLLAFIAKKTLPGKRSFGIRIWEAYPREKQL